MRHSKSGKKLSRTANERKALFRSLLLALFTCGGIKTTKAKAKTVACQADKLIFLAKKKTVAARRQAHKTLPKIKWVNLLFDEVAPTFQNQKSGFTRIISLGQRLGDGAEMVRLELTSKEKTNRSKK